MRFTLKKVSAFMFSMIFAILLLCFVLSDFLFPPDFFNVSTLDDFRRVPLQYPYEIADLNNMGRANLRIWGKDYIVQSGIVAYSWTTNVVFGETMFLSEDKKYFIFCMTNNSLTTFINKEAFINACATIDVENKSIQPVVTQWMNYWNLRSSSINRRAMGRPSQSGRQEPNNL